MQGKHKGKDKVGRTLFVLSFLGGFFFFFFVFFLLPWRLQDAQRLSPSHRTRPQCTHRGRASRGRGLSPWIRPSDGWRRGVGKRFFFFPLSTIGCEHTHQVAAPLDHRHTHCLLLSLFSFVFSFLAFSSLLYNILFQFL